MSEYQFCKVANEGRITIVTINRPDVMNALHPPAHREFDKIWRDFSADPEQWSPARGIGPSVRVPISNTELRVVSRSACLQVSLP